MDGFSGWFYSMRLANTIERVLFFLSLFIFLRDNCVCNAIIRRKAGHWVLFLLLVIVIIEVYQDNNIPIFSLEHQIARVLL